MGWKTIVIKNSERVNLFLDNIVITKDEISFKYNISDINCIIFEDFRTTITSRIINRLAKGKVLVIFTDENFLPSSFVYPVIAHNQQLKIIGNQLNWKKDNKLDLWRYIIKNKINNQILILKNNNIRNEKIRLMENYAKNVIEGDATNREAVAAKLYFKQLFGNTFLRDDKDNHINSFLNFGYTIIRSYIARTIVSKGLHPSISIFHHNRYDGFALADDLIEIFRPIIDDFVYKNVDENTILTREWKIKLINILNVQIEFKNRQMFLTNAIDEFIDDVIKFFNLNDINVINSPSANFIEYYEL